MSAAPEGFSPPSSEIFSEWTYIKDERLGMLCEARIPSDQESALAAFEADRHIESLYPVECSRGWVRNL